jgi:hypothetical protein
MATKEQLSYFRGAALRSGAYLNEDGCWSWDESCCSYCISQGGAEQRMIDGYNESPSNKLIDLNEISEATNGEICNTDSWAIRKYMDKVDNSWVEYPKKGGVAMNTITKELRWGFPFAGHL